MGRAGVGYPVRSPRGLTLGTPPQRVEILDPAERYDPDAIRPGARCSQQFLCPHRLQVAEVVECTRVGFQVVELPSVVMLSHERPPPPTHCGVAAVLPEQITPHVGTC